MKKMEYRLYDYTAINDLFTQIYRKITGEDAPYFTLVEKEEWVEAKNDERRLSSWDYQDFNKALDKAEESEATPLYYYEVGTHINIDEVLARTACEFFVKGGVVYRVLATAEENDTEVFYLEKAGLNVPFNDPGHPTQGIKIEIRRYTEGSDQHPLVKEFYPIAHLDALQKLNKDFLYVDGAEWKRDSAEIDEDRGTYVIYANPTGVTFE